VSAVILVTTPAQFATADLSADNNMASNLTLRWRRRGCHPGDLGL